MERFGFRIDRGLFPTKVPPHPQDCTRDPSPIHGLFSSLMLVIDRLINFFRLLCQLKYPAGQKVHSGFSVTFYGNTWTNFLANPAERHWGLNLHFLDNWCLSLGCQTKHHRLGFGLARDLSPPPSFLFPALGMGMSILSPPVRRRCWLALHLLTGPCVSFSVKRLFTSFVHFQLGCRMCFLLPL